MMARIMNIQEEDQAAQQEEQHDEEESQDEEDGEGEACEEGHARDDEACLMLMNDGEEHEHQ